MRKNSRNPLVLVFRSSYCEINKRAYEGLFGFTRGAGWNVQTIEYGRATGTTGTLPMVDVFQMDVPRLLKFWKPDGCIVESCIAPWKVDFDAFRRIPTVFFEWSPGELPHWASCVSGNGADMAVCAAKELLSLGLEDYGFVHFNKDYGWSRDRFKSFQQVIRMNGKKLHVFGSNAGGRGMGGGNAALLDWVRTLPKPCGVFASNDAAAVDVVMACRTAGIPIPEDIAVIGVDDVESDCDNLQPTLSSVRPDNERAGRLAGELLDDLMAHRVKTPCCRTYGALRLTRRASTRRIPGMDKRVALALEFIRCHACEGIGPEDVFAEMGCSRSLANLRFRQYAGHTILDEIHAIRLERVKELLSRPGVELSSIPDFCGYSSLVDLRRVFRSRVGQTLGEYRRSCAD